MTNTFPNFPFVGKWEMWHRLLACDSRLLHRLEAYATQPSTLLIGAFLMDFIPFIPFAAIEYSLIYMLGGGGLIGAIVIFVIAKMLRR